MSTNVAVFGADRNPGECGAWHVVTPLLANVSTWACDAGEFDVATAEDGESISLPLRPAIARQCWDLWNAEPKGNVIGGIVLFLWVVEVALMSVSVPFYQSAFSGAIARGTRR